MLLLAQVVDMQVTCALVTDTLHQVDQKAQDHADDHLASKNLEQEVGACLLGDEDGDHLVGGGKEHREQSAQRDHATGVQGCRRGREAALRKRTHERADNRAEEARFAHHGLGLIFGNAFDKLHDEIGDQKEGDEFERVDGGIGKYVHKLFHEAALYTAFCVNARSCVHTNNAARDV